MKVGILGTGLMGNPMALRLQQADFVVTAWNRTAAKLAPLEQAGIATAATPAAAIAATEVTLLMLTDASAIRQTVLSEAAQQALSGRTILQMGTIAPAESKAIAEQVQAAEGEYLEAPVLGSIPQAEEGTLIVMAGATPDQFERWQPVLRCLGETPLLMGPVGTAAATKLAMNQLIGTLTTAFSMSLGLVQKEGLDVEKFMQVVRQSALYAPTFDKKLARMCDRDFTNPNFPTKHLRKDMALFVQAAQAQGLEASTAASVVEVAEKAIKQGLGELDYSAVYSAVCPER